MKLLKVFGLILVTFTLFSCSNSAYKYQASNVAQMEFTSIDEHTLKKSFACDHHLMTSLLNRPMTADQAMMLAFTKQMQTQNNVSAFVDVVSIRGQKSVESQSSSSNSQYLTSIANDINAVTITGSL